MLTPVNNWRILLEESFTARMQFLTATSAFGLDLEEMLELPSMALRASSAYYVRNDSSIREST